MYLILLYELFLLFDLFHYCLIKKEKEKDVHYCAVSLFFFEDKITSKKIHLFY